MQHRCCPAPSRWAATTMVALASLNSPQQEDHLTQSPPTHTTLGRCKLGTEPASITKPISLIAWLTLSVLIQLQKQAAQQWVRRNLPGGKAMHGFDIAVCIVKLTWHVMQGSAHPSSQAQQGPFAASCYMNGGQPQTSHSYAPPPAAAQPQSTPNHNAMTGYPPPQGPTPPSGPPPSRYQPAQPQYAQQGWGAAVPQAHFGGMAPQSQGMLAGMQAGYGMQPPMQQYGAAPSYRPPGGGRGGGRGFMRGRG